MISIPDIYCIKSTEYTNHARRCFMTGEYCSQQTNIQKERQRLHEAHEINAFVVMNFSSVSDVVYESRIEPFVEHLNKYLYLDTEQQSIACVSTGNRPPDMKDGIKYNWNMVSKIHVRRADSNPVSNYIICNRICQQLQTADLIIVDVSVESANVFYEFGLATSFRKLILPICFSESFYEMRLPFKLEQAIHKQQENEALYYAKDSIDNSSTLKDLEKHIDCYPWRRKLFEHFGIRFQQAKKSIKTIDQNSEIEVEYTGVQYLEYDTASSEKFGFSDFQYRKFPYDTEIYHDKRVGLLLYNWLRENYNVKGAYKYNTLVVYTMDQFLNEEQAGQCIINYYNNVTKPMIEEYCFCGDRVAILGQPNQMWDDPKDNKTGKKLLYGVSDLIRIGMDQATYEAERRQIKTNDYMSNAAGNDEVKIKTHTRNRCIPLNPETPLYVNQFLYGIQQNLQALISKTDHIHSVCNEYKFFCLYNIMLNTLRYTDEIVVDLSSNSIQSMFWLGAAHGHGVHAITVRHELSEKEKIWAGIGEIQKDRPIFDIGGFWTAVLRYNETSSFYSQLSLIQQGIEQHSKLMLTETELAVLEEELFKDFYSAPPSSNENKLSEILVSDMGPKSRKRQAENLALESFYRERFWRQMLHSNQLHLFIPMNDGVDTSGPRLQVIKWDMDAVAELSHYLSKRTVIGQYHFDALRKGEYYVCNLPSIDTSKENYIIIGEETKPFHNSKAAPQSLVDIINSIEGIEIHAKSMFKEVRASKLACHKDNVFPIQYRGFSNNERSKDGSPFFSLECISCTKRNTAKERFEILPSDNFPTTITIQCVKDTVQAHYPSSDPKNTLSACRFHFDISNGIQDDPTALLVTASIRCSPAPNSGCPSPFDSITHIVWSQIFQQPLTLTWSNGVYKAMGESLNSPELFKEIFSKFDLQLNENQTLTLCSRSSHTADDSTKCLQFSIPAQLLLWRERDDNGENMKYYCSLIGVSGPATKALTSILVDRNQKKRILNLDDNALSTDFDIFIPLNILQSNIREQFLEKLNNDLDNIKPKPTLPIKEYLSTMLYRYFLPFLSRADEKRIYNALYAFLLTEYNNATDIDTIMKVLEARLKNFRGVDTIFDVIVSSATDPNNTDARKIEDIKLSENDAVVCLFVNSQTTQPSKGEHLNGEKNETS